jgi:hypothetical protein
VPQSSTRIRTLVARSAYERLGHVSFAERESGCHWLQQLFANLIQAQIMGLVLIKKQDHMLILAHILTLVQYYRKKMDPWNLEVPADRWYALNLYFRLEHTLALVCVLHLDHVMTLVQY